MLSKEQIQAAEDLQVEDFDVPEWGGTIKLIDLSAGQRQEIEFRCAKSTAQGSPVSIRTLKVAVCSMVMVDDDRKPMFTEVEAEKTLAGKSAAVIDRIFNRACERGGLLKKDVEALAKN